MGSRICFDSSVWNAILNNEAQRDSSSEITTRILPGSVFGQSSFAVDLSTSFLPTTAVAFE